MNLATRLTAPVRVAGMGMYAPQGLLTNEELERLVDTSDEWIVQRTGIKRRHRAAADEYTSDLCIGAIEDLLRHHPHVDLQRVGFIFVASTTPDYVYPSLAAMLQNHFGIPKTTGALDISAACAGFCSGMNVAAGMIASGQASSVLVVAGETLTRTIDYADRSTCVLFGDGAGAAVLTYDEDSGMAGMCSGTDGSAGPALFRTAIRPDMAGVIDGSGMLRQEGREIYRWVLENIPGVVGTILERAQLQADDIDWFVPHSANMRMIEALCKRLQFPMERTLTSVEEYGNTSAVSIPLALVPAIRDGRIKSGDKILIVGFGGGLVSAGCVLTWP